MGKDSAVDHVAQADSLIEELTRVERVGPVVDLEAIEFAVERFVARMDWPSTGLQPADAGEERLYRLDSRGGDGPAVYLVSDGVGVVSPPHEHETWAVVAGIAGEEINHLFARTRTSASSSTSRSAESRMVTRFDTKVVGPGQTLALAADAVHSTEVAGDSPTFHVHVYGRSLAGLSSFVDRRFIDASSRLGARLDREN